MPVKQQSVRSEVSFGKINRNNILIGGGIGLTNVLLTMDSTNGIIREGSGVGYAAFLIIQKYRHIGKGIYYTPSLIAGPEHISYSINDELNSKIIQRDFSTGGFIRIRPVSFAYPFSFGASSRKSFIVAADLGELYFTLRNQKSDEQNASISGKTRKSSGSTFLLGFPVAVRVSLGF